MINFIKKLFGLNKPEKTAPKTVAKKKRTYTRKRKDAK
jgi:hypothetical protein